MKINGVLEDIGAEIGFTATTTLVAWFGGRTLYVPAAASETHPICRIIGIAAMRRLCAEWGSESLDLPEGLFAEQARRDRDIAVFIGQGVSDQLIAAVTGLHPKRVGQIRRRIAADGLVPLPENAQEKPPEKTGEKGGGMNRLENRAARAEHFATVEGGAT